MTLEEANNYIDKNYDRLFKTYKNLNLLASMFDSENDTYYIKSNIGQFPEDKYQETSLEITRNENKEGEVSIKSFPGEIFSTILQKNIETDLKTSNTKNIKPGSLIQNIYNKHFPFHGTLGLVFKILNRNEEYLLSNKHVIGRTGMHKNEPIISYKNKKQIGTYTNGIIDHYIDVAYGIISSNISTPTSTKKPIKVDTNINIPSIVKIDNSEVKVVSSNAYIRIEDDDFYNPSKIMRKQILVDKIMIPGQSGTAALNYNKTEIIGLVFAKNNNYSILNKIDVIFNYVAEKESITKQQISIINQF